MNSSKLLFYFQHIQKIILKLSDCARSQSDYIPAHYTVLLNILCKIIRYVFSGKHLPFYFFFTTSFVLIKVWKRA